MTVVEKRRAAKSTRGTGARRAVRRPSADEMGMIEHNLHQLELSIRAARQHRSDPEMVVRNLDHALRVLHSTDRFLGFRKVSKAKLARAGIVEE
jgi:hypothetical protein